MEIVTESSETTKEVIPDSPDSDLEDTQDNSVKKADLDTQDNSVKKADLDTSSIVNINLANNLKKVDTEIHLRIKQRNGKKCISIIEGLNKIPALNKSALQQLVKKFRKTFNCSVTIKEDGKFVELQGDHRNGVQAQLIKLGFCKLEDIKFHGS